MFVLSVYISQNDLYQQTTDSEDHPVLTDYTFI